MEKLMEKLLQELDKHAGMEQAVIRLIAECKFDKATELLKSVDYSIIDEICVELGRLTEQRLQTEKNIEEYIGELPGNQQYEFTTAASIKSRVIQSHASLNETILHYLSINKPFRFTMEYEPEALNSKIKIESNYEAPEKINL